MVIKANKTYSNTQFVIFYGKCLRFKAIEGFTVWRYGTGKKVSPLCKILSNSLGAKTLVFFYRKFFLVLLNNTLLLAFHCCLILLYKVVYFFYPFLFCFIIGNLHNCLKMDISFFFFLDLSLLVVFGYFLSNLCQFVYRALGC